VGKLRCPFDQPVGFASAGAEAYTDFCALAGKGKGTRHRLPAVYSFRYWAEAGGLVSYGPDNLDSFRRAAG